MNHAIDAMKAQLRVVIDELEDLKKAQTPARLVFGSPCSGVLNASNVWGLDWFDATGFAVVYPGGLHTGADLNRPNYTDSNQPVFAAADGQVVFAGTVKGWQGQVVVLKHWLEDGQVVWTRYAHIRDVCQAEAVRRGDVIGYIADYNVDGPRGDHLHFDIARIDLGERPGDWPGMDRERLMKAYLNPVEWLKARMRDEG